jgi:TolB-like protein/DNA-binding winged helix-turn-helix (wHTH) protein
MDAMVERRFGRFVIQPGRRQLLIDGRPAKIGSRAFDILMALVERRQRVVTKDELLDLVWPQIAVEESNLQVHVMALRKLLGADAIATIPGRGYQFTAPLDELLTPIPAVAARLSLGKPAIESPAESGAGRSSGFRGDFRHVGLAFAAGLIALILAVGAWHFVRAISSAPVVSKATATAEAKHLSIVALPFANLSNDPAQDYFADGITDNLTTELSRIHNSFVIARNTAFTFKGKNADAREIGKELGVRYVLEGSVQRDQNRVRVNAQLIDADSGAHLWADRFEEDVADLFKLQDQVVARLANTLGYELVKAEAAKGARSKNPDAIDLAMRGWVLLQQQPPMKDNAKVARDLFDQALKIDPDDSDALAGDAMTYAFDIVFGWTSLQIDYDAKILGQANRAIAVAPDNVRAYYAKSIYLFLRRPNEALGAADAGLAVNSNYANLYEARGFAEVSLGRFEQAKSDTQQAMRLSPRDPYLGSWHQVLGDAELGARHFDAAIDEYNKAIDAGFRVFVPYVDLAAAYALKGETEEAKSALTEGRRLNPELTLAWLTDHAPNIPPLFEGLRKAGLPEK